MKPCIFIRHIHRTLTALAAFAAFAAFAAVAAIAAIAPRTFSMPRWNIKLLMLNTQRYRRPSKLRRRWMQELP